jgi:nucleotide-binding universal stress UspA family protein
MFRRIMVPVDLTHADRLEKALKLSAELAGSGGAEVVFVGVTGTEPSAVARSPEEFAQKMARFAEETGARLGLRGARGVAIHLHDVTVELDRALIAKAREIDADLVVMASHVPGGLEHWIASNAGYVAAHAPMSVFVVRGA